MWWPLGSTAPRVAKALATMNMTGGTGLVG
jgi:hypothetical protein